MNRDTKALDALAMASLPENALIARLANKYVNRPFDMEQCRAVIRTTYPDRGQLGRLAQLLWDERARQEPIRNGRVAIKRALDALKRPYTWDLTIRGPILRDAEPLECSARRKREWLRLAQLNFGDYIRSVFDEEILALMELTSQDCRTYRVDWLDTGIRPAISSLVRVTVEGSKGAFEQEFLLYKVPGASKAMSALVDLCHSIRDAWAMQVPPAATLFVKTHGIKSKRTDFDTQEIVLVDADGDEQRFPWRGKVDE